jgi:penicillin-binding protein 2
MKRAIAVSSDVYFYEIGGGFENQKGLGIANIERYMKMFGFGLKEDGLFFEGPQGVVPSPAWKAKAFPGDPWRIGDTYFTSIGQYGWQSTPLQAIKATASIANGGKLPVPSVMAIATGTEMVSIPQIQIDNRLFEVAKEGMRDAVSGGGTSAGLNVAYVDVAAKTGTAELGSKKQFVNSLVVGFFPYDKPRYAFTVVMERGPVHNSFGGVFVMRGLLDWMSQNATEYF